MIGAFRIDLVSSRIIFRAAAIGIVNIFLNEDSHHEINI
jgi:hypothetical protein